MQWPCRRQQLIRRFYTGFCGKNGRTRRRGQSNREKNKTSIQGLQVPYDSKKLKMYFPRHKRRQAARHGLFT
jgi:hypothetical protein